MSAPAPRVSLVTPSFNQGAFLRRCIDSVLNQDYPHVDYFVLDGGSTDGSREILESYAAKLIWRSRPDGGQAAAINEGLQRASGEIVGFLNSDDVLLQGAVSSAVAALKRRPDVDVVYGEASVIDARDRELRRYPTQPFDPQVFVGHCFISQPATFWRRSLHERFGYFDPRFDHTLDYEFWIRLMCGGARFLHVEQKWALAREHADAKSQRLRGDIFRQIRDLELKHLGYCDRNWWEQYLRYLRDERGGLWRLFPGGRNRRLHWAALGPWLFWRRFC